MIPRANADFWWEIMSARSPREYGYGGPWHRDDTYVTTDCSGLVANCLEALTRGREGFDWDREPFSTESWRVLDYGQAGPFGSICVKSPADIPPDAAVGIGLHHGGGGPESHMGCTVFDPDWGQTNCESSGDYGQRMGGPARGLFLPDGKTVWRYWNDYAYLPGPIEAGKSWAPVSEALTGEENLMATADDVVRQINGEPVTLYEGSDAQAGQPGGPWRTGYARDWWNRTAWEVTRFLPGVDHNKNGDGKSGKATMRDSIARLVFETTLWTNKPTLGELIARRSGRETTHGHSRDAAGYGDATVRILGRIVEEMNKQGYNIKIDDLLS